MVSIAILGCSSPIGNEYKNVDSIVLASEWADWVIVGSFGPPGPFELVEVVHCEVNEPCSWSYKGQSHTYNKFYDYQLAVLRLQPVQGDLAHVVLRSATKVGS